MSMPTEHDRELWRKAIEKPGEITLEEKRAILGLVDPTTQLTNSLAVSGMTPDQLEEKARTQPETLTEKECYLIDEGYHVDGTRAHLDRSGVKWSHEDNMAREAAKDALRTPKDVELENAVTRRRNFFFRQQLKAAQDRMAKRGQNLDKPCTWISRLIDPSKPIHEQTVRWGFIVLRDESSKCSKEEWESFLRQLNNLAYERGLFYLLGASFINGTKHLIVQEGFVDKRDRESLQTAFEKAEAGIRNSHILKNTILLVDSDVIASFRGGNSAANPWLWAYEASMLATPALPSQIDGYSGRMKVAIDSLFTWFYAARKEEIYSMELFWKKAQRQPDQAWSVATSEWKYHGPLVLLEKGSSYLRDTYELEGWT